jgi:hypothetical protein
VAGTSPFDYASSASASIDNEIMNGKLDDAVPTFVFLRAIGVHPDTVLLADEVQAHFKYAPSRYAYHSMHALIEPKRKRFAKWIKPVEARPTEIVNAIIEMEECSTIDAEMLYDMYTPEQIETIRKRMNLLEQQKKGKKK